MNEPAATRSAEENEILEVEQNWVDVIMRNDKEAAALILADEFRLTGSALERLSTGRAATKDLWLSTLPMIETRAFEFNEVQVTVYGSVAACFVRATLDWSIQGRKLPSNYLLTDLWVNREGRWQVVTRVSEPLD